ncbi:hypothetical protein LTR78_001328 [Recurvomyces mirabilis]|uniref:Uncharacterized protein n=1 Tax=Recurvomyces mirabilis TaxID=574656 RepID=A0AAE0WVL4_9PEZI|nr:hypothetical protein LTR78_001328 [Recurvomyces mirabilis]KAK5161305.1 hypothetical protein LTS14_001101 [Recurvomyces mirabilis]
MLSLLKKLVAVGLLASTVVSIHPICRRPGCPPSDLPGHKSDVPTTLATGPLVAREQGNPEATSSDVVVVVETSLPTPTTVLPIVTTDVSTTPSSATAVDLDIVTVEFPANSTDGTNETMPYTAFLREAVQAVAIAAVDHTLIVTGAYGGAYEMSPLQEQLGHVVGLVQKFGYEYGVNRTLTCTNQTCMRNVILNAMDTTQMAAMVQTKKVIQPTLDAMGQDGAWSSVLLDVALAGQQSQTSEHLEDYPVNGEGESSTPAQSTLGPWVIPIAPIMLPFQDPDGTSQNESQDVSTDESQPSDVPKWKRGGSTNRLYGEPGTFSELLKAIKNAYSMRWSRLFRFLSSHKGYDQLTKSNLLKHNPHLLDSEDEIEEMNEEKGIENARKWARAQRTAEATTDFEEIFMDLEGDVTIPDRLIPRTLPPEWADLGRRAFQDRLMQTSLEAWADDTLGLEYRDMFDMRGVIRRVRGELRFDPHGALPPVAQPPRGSQPRPVPGGPPVPLLPLGAPPPLAPAPAGPAGGRPRPGLSPRPQAPPDQGPSPEKFTSAQPQEATPTPQQPPFTPAASHVPTTLLVQTSRSTRSSSSSTQTTMSIVTPQSTPPSQYKSGCNVPLAITGNDDATQEEFAAAQAAHDPIAYSQDACPNIHPPTTLGLAPPAPLRLLEPRLHQKQQRRNTRRIRRRACAHDPVALAHQGCTPFKPIIQPANICWPPPSADNTTKLFKSRQTHLLVTSWICDATVEEFKAARAKGDVNLRGRLEEDDVGGLDDGFEDFDPVTGIS